jgi:hypothetical protein
LYNLCLCPPTLYGIRLGIGDITRAGGAHGGHGIITNTMVFIGTGIGIIMATTVVDIIIDMVVGTAFITAVTGLIPPS